MKARYRILLVTALSLSALVLLSSACRTYPERPQIVTFVIVRHAEVAPDGTKDPALSEAGLARAHALAASLPQHAVAAYATSYRRTQQTAQVAADTNHAWKVPVTTYDASLPAEEFARQLRIRHLAGVVVVVGHSNTVPAIASALCHCTVAPMREDEFDRRISVSIDTLIHPGATTFDESRY
jgi:phosphohistidine phosphatase SixA